MSLKKTVDLFKFFDHKASFSCACARRHRIGAGCGDFSRFFPGVWKTNGKGENLLDTHISAMFFVFVVVFLSVCCGKCNSGDPQFLRSEPRSRVTKKGSSVVPKKGVGLAGFSSEFFKVQNQKPSERQKTERFQTQPVQLFPFAKSWCQWHWHRITPPLVTRAFHGHWVPTTGHVVAKASIEHRQRCGSQGGLSLLGSGSLVTISEKKQNSIYQ